MIVFEIPQLLFRVGELVHFFLRHSLGLIFPNSLLSMRVNCRANSRGLISNSLADLKFDGKIGTGIALTDSGTDAGFSRP